MFNESWYLPPSPTPINSIPDSKDEASEADIPLNEEISTLEESLISFRLSGPNEGLSRKGQPDDEPASSEVSVMQSLHQKPRRWLTRKEKGKMKMPEYGIEVGASDRSESDAARSEDGPPELRSENRQTRSCVNPPARRTP